MVQDSLKLRRSCGLFVFNTDDTDYVHGNTAKEIRYLFLSSNKRLIMEFHLYFSNNVTPHL